MTEPTSWDDLRFVLAVSRARTLVEAASLLNVTHGTVSRRVAALEKRSGDRLFARSPQGYVPTPVGERLVAAALAMEHAVVALDRDLLEGQVSGALTVSTLSIFVRALGPGLTRFRCENPEIRLIVNTTRELASVDRNEAQVVIRATDRPPEGLVGRSIGRLAFAPYASRALVEAMGSDPCELPWIDWQDCFGKRRLAEFLATRAPNARRVAEVAVFEDMLALLRAGFGAAAIPCIDGDVDSELVRVGEPIPSFGIGIWLLTHASLKSAPRVRAFLDHIGAELDGLRSRFEGDTT